MNNSQNIINNKVEKIFFSMKNYNLLFDVINQHFKSTLEHNIGDDEKNLLMEVMEYIYNSSSQKPQNVKIMQHIKKLNKLCLNKIILIINNKLHEDLLPSDDDLNFSDNKDVYNELLPKSSSNNKELHINTRPNTYNSITPHRIDSSYNDKIKHDDVSKAYENMVKNRNETKSSDIVPMTHDFQEKIEENNIQVSNRFDDELKNRNYENESSLNLLNQDNSNLLNQDNSTNLSNQDNSTNLLNQDNSNLFNQDNSTLNLSSFDNNNPNDSNNTSLLGLPLDNLGQIITDNKNDIPKEFSSLKEIDNEKTFFGGDTPKASGQDVLIKQPTIYNKLYDNYHKGYTKDYYLVIDSRDRNQDLYPNSSNYQIDFNEVYKDILSIELISAEIPKSSYLINNSNNKIYFEETTGIEFVATIANGNYTPITLANEIQSVLNTIGNSNYTVTVDNILTNKFTFTSDLSAGAGHFNLIFNGGTEKYNNITRTTYKDNSIGSIIGFTRVNMTGSNTYTGQNQYNLNGENYIFLNIKELENLDSITDANSSGTNSFTKITLDVDNTNTKYYKAENDYISQKIFVPPLPKLGQMIIKFLTYNNDLYDFSGREHSLYFKITTFNQNQKYYGEISSLPKDI